MGLLDRIEQQTGTMRLPLFAVTVAAVPCPDTPVILTLHWHGFLREKIAEVEGAKAVSFRSVPSSALQLNERWDDLIDRIETEAIDDRLGDSNALTLAGGTFHVIGNDDGITYDPSNNGTLWISSLAQNQTIRQYTLTGEVISSFTIPTGASALARDPHDGTLWFGDGFEGTFYHYNTRGQFLGSITYPALAGSNHLGGEFRLSRAARVSTSSDGAR